LIEETKTYPKWVGLVLAFLLTGSAHFLSSDRKGGILWYVTLLLLGVVAMAVIAIPGTVSYLLGIAAIFVMFGLWLRMMRQSYRPVRRIGWIGWVCILAIRIGLNYGTGTVTRQCLHPFKISSGAMAPTLFGIRAETIRPDSPSRPNLFQRLVTGSRFVKVKAEKAGTISESYLSPAPPPCRQVMVGEQLYDLPRSVRPIILPGNQVSAGDTIWSGTITMGDHIFVERFTYRFSQPHRGDIVVFETDGIRGIQQNTHYVKRVAGLPGERVRIDPPYLIINDHIVTTPSIFKTIAASQDGYSGFQTTMHGAFSTPSDVFVLGPDEYFVLGDNTTNSKDSRYWGAVPRKNIIGKVTRIYWPLNRINALTGRQ